jgi:hypothetical protein
MKPFTKLATTLLATTATAAAAPPLSSANHSVPRDEAFIARALKDVPVSTVRECLATKALVGSDASLGKAAKGFESWHHIGRVACMHDEASGSIQAVHLAGGANGARNTLVSITRGFEPARDPDHPERPGPRFEICTLVKDGRELITDQKGKVLQSSIGGNGQSLSSGAERSLNEYVLALK